MQKSQFYKLTPMQQQQVIKQYNQAQAKKEQWHEILTAAGNLAGATTPNTGKSWTTSKSSSEHISRGPNSYSRSSSSSGTNVSVHVNSAKAAISALDALTTNK